LTPHNGNNAEQSPTHANETNPMKSTVLHISAL